MVQVFQPLKVGDGDTAGVDVHVGDDEGAVLLQDLVSGRCDWSVGCFSNDLGLHLVSVALVDHLLHGGRHQNISLLEHHVLPCVGLRTRKAYDGALFNPPVLKSLGVDAVGVPDGSVPLGNANAGGASPGEVPAGVEANVTKALDNVGLSRPARSLTNHGHEVGFIDEVLKTMEHATACGAGPCVDTSLVDGLASDAGACIQVGVPNGVGIGVCNPGHLPLACTHVRGGHVDARSQESLPG